jgi:hypothetical protein
LPNQAGGWRFGGVRLNAYGYDRAADGLRLALVWSAGETMEADYSWFVHLLDASGQIVAQQDRQPLGGYAPTSTWTPGTTGTDRLYFPIMTEVVQVRIGWVDPTNGERLPVFGANGERLTEDFVLLDVEGA